MRNDQRLLGEHCLPANRVSSEPEIGLEQGQMAKLARCSFEKQLQTALILSVT